MRKALQIVIAVLVVAGIEPTQANDDEVVEGQSTDEAHGMLYDEQLSAIAEAVPEFGGMYVADDERTLFVYVTERRPSIVADLRHALRDVFPKQGLPARMRLLEARFSFAQLARWKDKARELLSIDDVVMTDIDDRANLLTIGATRRGLEGRVEEELTARGVPPEGWTIEQVAVPEEDTSVQDFHRPALGGLQIVSDGGGACTYGLTGIRNGVVGFLTNSHCTRVRGGVESTRFAQPFFDADGANEVGTEIADPSYFTGGRCPQARQCRFSDSAFVQRRSVVSVSRSIPRTPIGTLEWDGSSKLFVVGEVSSVAGLVVRKLGRTTGHTIGKIDRTCVDVNAKAPFTYLCQTITTYDRDDGDSGAPVFRFTDCTVNGVADKCAQIFGIHRGPSDDGTGGAFSPIGLIQRSDELGLVYTCVTDNC